MTTQNPKDIIEIVIQVLKTAVAVIKLVIEVINFFK